MHSCCITIIPTVVHAFLPLNVYTHMYNYLTEVKNFKSLAYTYVRMYNSYV